MNSEDLIAACRTDLNDLAAPPLWSDDELYRFADDAQKTFVRTIGGIGDASSAITQLDVVVGVFWTNLDESILKIRDAYLVSDGRPIQVVNYEDLAQYGVRFDNSTGPVRFLIIGMQPKLGRFFPTPSVAGVVQLMVDRLPACDLTADAAPQELEVDKQHHEALLLRMKEMAYLKQDAETLNKTKSADFGEQFRAYSTWAKQEKDRAKHKTRVVSYGGVGANSPYRTSHGPSNDYYNRG